MPEIMPEVSDYLDCFNMCDSQLRPESIYALDWNIVIRVAEVKGINIDDKFFAMLRAFENEIREEIRQNGR